MRDPESFPQGGQSELRERVLDHLSFLVKDLKEACRNLLKGESRYGILLLIMSASEVLSLYWAGSRRVAGNRGSRALYGFLVRYFPRFNVSAKDERGHYFRVRIPLNREGGKASKRLKIPSALIHLYRRGAMEELVCKDQEDLDRCVVMEKGKWGFVVEPRLLALDFFEAMDSFLADVESDQSITQRSIKRFVALYG